MKKHFKKILIIMFAMLAALFTLAGCKLGESLEDVIEQNNLVSQITYYANGEQAIFTPNYSKECNLYYRENTQPANIGEDGSLGIEYAGYEIVGWYYVDLDENDQPITTGSYQYKGETCYIYKLTDQKFDFSQRMQAGDHWIIAAKWVKISRVKVVLVHDDPNVSVPVDTSKLTTESPLYDEESQTFKTAVANGDVIQSYPYDENGKRASLPNDPITVAENVYTFLAYYADKECTKPVAYPLLRTEVDEVVYAKYITGNWTVVRAKEGVANMLKSMTLASRKYYFLPGSEFDCTGLKIELAASTACEIQGNGAVLKNLTVDAYVKGDAASIFGTIKSTAKIENLTFENFNVTYRMSKSDASIYFLFSEIAAGATITNVSVQGSLKIVKSEDRKVINMPKVEDEYIFTHCLFGSPYETDEAYYAENNDGFKVVGNGADFITITSETN